MSSTHPPPSTLRFFCLYMVLNTYNWSWVADIITTQFWRSFLYTEISRLIDINFLCFFSLILLSFPTYGCCHPLIKFANVQKQQTYGYANIYCFVKNGPANSSLFCLRNKTMDDKLIFIPRNDDKQNYRFCRSKLLLLNILIFKLDFTFKKGLQI